MIIRGKVSWFGGPDDTGVAPDEGLAFIYHVSDKPELFLPEQPPGTTGLARRLDPEKLYIACRWDYAEPDQSKQELLKHLAIVSAPSTGKSVLAAPADKGPNSNTGRVADVSPGVMEALGIETDDEVEVIYPCPEEKPMNIHRVAISAGHGKYVAGASGYIEEAEETPFVMRAVAEELRKRGVSTVEFWDQVSKTQDANLAAIVDWHNGQKRDLDVSIHFNSSGDDKVLNPIGTECLYVTQSLLAAQVSASLATVGLINRGAKYRSDLAFLNGTEMPAILVEVLFVNSEADVYLYQTEFDPICAAIASGIAGEAMPLPPEPPDDVKTVAVALTVPPGVSVAISVNGVRLTHAP